jgi:hypothetical protein
MNVAAYSSPRGGARMGSFMSWKAWLFVSGLGTLVVASACGLEFSSDGGAGSGAGPAIPCDEVTDCPTPGSACAEVTCQLGTCQTRALPDGVLPNQLQTAGDCKQARCEGGELVIQADELDAPNDQMDCTEDTCVGDMPSHRNLEQGAPCGDGSLMCDGNGVCTGCTSPDQCGPMTYCVFYNCNSGQCVVEQRHQDAALPDAQQVDGDCKVKTCGLDGQGMSERPMPKDTPDDLDCVNRGCTKNGNVTETPVASGQPCLVTDDGTCCDGLCVLAPICAGVGGDIGVGGAQ